MLRFEEIYGIYSPLFELMLLSIERKTDGDLKVYMGVLELLKSQIEVEMESLQERIDTST